MEDIDFLTQKEVSDFIQSNLEVDVNKLILNPPKEFKDTIRSIADQILARQKAKGKLGEWVTDGSLLFPPPLSIEQASSLVTANYKKHLIQGDHLIDLTGGTGIDCLALSESFNQTTYVEQSEWLCRVMHHNITALKKNIQIVNETAEHFLENFNETATFFIDPARRDQNRKKVFQLEDCTPNLIELLPQLRQKSTSVLVKLSPLLDISSILSSVPDVKTLFVVSLKNDCKELLVLLDFTKKRDPEVVAVNLESDQPNFSYTHSMESVSVVDFSALEKYIYEPNASIMKAGAFKLIASQFGLKKLGVNTHLYTSGQLVRSFPGKIFQLQEKSTRDSITTYAPDRYINVITRNYPLTPAQVKKKYKVKDGGAFYLIGYKDLNDKPQLIIAKRLNVQESAP